MTRPETTALTARRETLAEAIKTIMDEANKGQKAAPPGVRLSYGGGLRRAAMLLDELLGDAMREERLHLDIDPPVGGAK